MLISNDQLLQIINGGRDMGLLVPESLPPINRDENRHKVALVVGGSNNVMDEFNRARDMCAECERQITTIVCNSMTATFPYVIDHMVSLHPDQAPEWFTAREKAGFPKLTHRWAHRDYVGFTDHTKDWQASSGGLATKIAREIGHTHVILCGVPMTVEDQHFLRRQDWHAAHGFRRGWGRHIVQLKPFVRSMSGWTQRQFGFPDHIWIKRDPDDPYPMHIQHVSLKA